MLAMWEINNSHLRDKMTKPYYEVHITFMQEKNSSIFVSDRWKFSMIDGDPILGKGVKCYLTRQYPRSKSTNVIKNEIEEIASRLTKLNCKVIRKKIELVIFDERVTQ